MMMKMKVMSKEFKEVAGLLKVIRLLNLKAKISHKAQPVQTMQVLRILEQVDQRKWTQQWIMS